MGSLEVSRYGSLYAKITQTNKLTKQDMTIASFLSRPVEIRIPDTWNPDSYEYQTLTSLEFKCEKNLNSFAVFGCHLNSNAVVICILNTKPESRHFRHSFAQINIQNLDKILGFWMQPIQTKPFNNQTAFYQLITSLVQYSVPLCFNLEEILETLTKIWYPAMVAWR